MCGKINYMIFPVHVRYLSKMQEIMDMRISVFRSRSFLALSVLSMKWLVYLLDIKNTCCQSIKIMASCNR